MDLKPVAYAYLQSCPLSSIFFFQSA